MGIWTVTPILRIFDERKAKEFYVDFLGFSIRFEHRFGENFPLHMGLSLSDCTLHLSEHHGDACPGAQVRIRCDLIEQCLATFVSKDYKFAKPRAPNATPWQTLEATISDPLREPPDICSRKMIATSACGHKVSSARNLRPLSISRVGPSAAFGP